MLALREWQSALMPHEPEKTMSDKKRTTVTTIETHEVWIIRNVVPEVPAGLVTLMPPEGQTAISLLAEGNNTNQEEEETTK